MFSLSSGLVRRTAGAPGRYSRDLSPAASRRGRPGLGEPHVRRDRRRRRVGGVERRQSSVSSVTSSRVPSASRASLSTPSHDCDVVGVELDPQLVAALARPRSSDAADRARAPRAAHAAARGGPCPATPSRPLPVSGRGTRAGTGGRAPGRSASSAIVQVPELARAASRRRSTSARRASPEPLAPQPLEPVHRSAGCTSRGVLHRRPQAVGVEPGDVGFGLLARARRHDGLALVVHLHA